MKNNFPVRKHTRLKNYDYSQNGYYFVTICCDKNKNYFGKIVSVGRGLAPAEKAVKLSRKGKIAERQLLLLTKRYSSVRVDKYIVMPNHIHAIIIIENCNDGDTAGASPRPTLSDIICAYKSLTTRECNYADNAPSRKIFQTSFYDRVIRSQNEYENIWKYIYGNANKSK